jgi:DNA-binding NarL/FixJ family response regulator
VKDRIATIRSNSYNGRVMRSLSTALIVDDNDFVRIALRMLLEERTGLRICGEAADGAEAVHKAKGLRPDLVLMDLTMPRMGGAEAASIIKQMLPDTRIVVFTLYSDPDDEDLAKALGADLVVSKSDGVARLLDAVQSLVAGQV